MIAIAFALEFESACFRARHDPRLRVAVWLLGTMGAAVAESLERKLAEVRPRLVISAGFAGGLQPDVRVGDLVLGSNASAPEIVEKLELAGRWRIGGIQTEAAIIEKAEDKRRLGEATGCLAGDLETTHMAKVCAEHDLPMLAIRCISDALDDDMPVPADILLDPKTGPPVPLALFRFLLANPLAAPAFARLLKNAKAAQAQLASGLEEILPQLLRMV